MSEIEIGEFVRFKNGKIQKVDKDEAERLNIFNDYVLKHSKKHNRFNRRRRFCKWKLCSTSFRRI